MTRLNFTNFLWICLWPSLGLTLTALRYVMLTDVLPVCGWRHFFTCASISGNKHNTGDSNQILLNDEDRNYLLWELRTAVKVCYLRLLYYRLDQQGHVLPYLAKMVPRRQFAKPAVWQDRPNWMLCSCFAVEPHQGRRSLWDRGDMSPNIYVGGTSMVMSPQYFRSDVV